jgi:tetratricopeptide (TPR) repeat protein
LNPTYSVCRSVYNVNRHEEAAAIFEQCVTKEPGSSYSWHYLGFNLHRAGKERSRAQEAYRKALELEPTNPWWCRRYITFLLECAKFQAARDVFSQFGETIGDSLTDLSSAADFYLKLSAQWLSHGKPKEACRILDIFSSRYGRSDDRFGRLERRCRHALEVEELGAEVYHPNFPFDEREAAKASAPRALVNRVGDQEYRIYFAVEMLEPKSGRIFRKPLSASEWEESANEPALEAQGFYFIGVLQNDKNSPAFSMRQDLPSFWRPTLPSEF